MTLVDSRADIFAVIPFKKSTCSRIAALSSDRIASHSDSRAEIALAQSSRIRSWGVGCTAWQDCQRRITKHHPVCRVANLVFSPELSACSVTQSPQVRSSRGDNYGFINANLYHGDAVVATSRRSSFSVVENVPSVRPTIPQSLVRVRRYRTWLQLLPTCESDPQVALKPNLTACRGIAVERTCVDLSAWIPSILYFRAILPRCTCVRTAAQTTPA